MTDNQFSLRIQSGSNSYLVDITKQPIRFLNSINRQQVNEDLIPEDCRQYLQRNLKALRESSRQLIDYTDNITKDHPSCSAMGKGFNTSLTIHKTRDGTYQADVSFYDRQGAGNYHATGVLAGGLRTLAEISACKRKPTINWQTGDLTSIRFDSIFDLQKALEPLIKARGAEQNIR